MQNNTVKERKSNNQNENNQNLKMYAATNDIHNGIVYWTEQFCQNKNFWTKPFYQVSVHLLLIGRNSFWTHIQLLGIIWKNFFIMLGIIWKISL